MTALDDDDTLADQLVHALNHGNWAEAERIAAIFDTPRPALELLPSALWYASVGLKVFPLTPRSKVPLPGSRGCKDATDNPHRIRGWWGGLPNANVAVATGHLVDVIDIDGPDGVASWVTMFESMPHRYGTVSTPRAGGSHLYVKAVAGRGNKARLADGIDYRGAGGYVVAPPSATDRGPYVWRTPLDVAGLTGDTTGDAA